MKILLASSSTVACEIFSALIEDSDQFEVIGFLTNKDKAAGRGQREVANDFAKWAATMKLPIYKVEDSSGIFEVLDLTKADLVITVAFGRIIKQENLLKPKYGWLNVHFSLLPKYRGAAPVQHAIMNGENKTGVSIFQMESGLDTGPIFKQVEYLLPRFATTSSVLRDLSRLSIPAIKETIKKVLGGIAPKEQSEFSLQPTMAPKISKLDGQLDFNLQIDQISARYRALVHSPGVFANLDNQRIKFEALDFQKESMSSSKAGQIIITGKDMFIAAKDGLVKVIQLKPEGKVSMSGAEFLRGRANLVGKILN